MNRCQICGCIQTGMAGCPCVKKLKAKCNRLQAIVDKMSKLTKDNKGACPGCTVFVLHPEDQRIIKIVLDDASWLTGWWHYKNGKAIHYNVSMTYSTRKAAEEAKEK